MIFEVVSKTISTVANRIASLRKQGEDLFYSLNAIKDALLKVAEEISVTNGTNSDIVTEKLWKCRPNPACKVETTTHQNINNVTATAIVFANVATYDDLSARNDKSAKFHSNTVTNTRLTVHEEGKYRMTGYALWGNLASFTGAVELWIRKNGTTILAASSGDFFTGFDQAKRYNVATEDYMFPGEYVELIAWQVNSGGGNGPRIEVANFTISGRI